MSDALRMNEKEHNYSNNLCSGVSPTSPAPLSKSDTDCRRLNPTKSTRDAPSILRPVLLFAPSGRNLYTHYPLAWRRARNNNAQSRCLALGNCHTTACNKVTKWQLSYSKVAVPLVMFAYEVQIGSLLNTLSVKGVS